MSIDDRRRPLGATALAGLGCAAALVSFGAQAQQGFFTGGAGASFTADEAARGKAAYAANCVSCHGANLDDGEFGPPLKGDSFKGHWTGQSQEALFNYIQARMPPSGPGPWARRPTPTSKPISCKAMAPSPAPGEGQARPPLRRPPPAPPLQLRSMRRSSASTTRSTTLRSPGAPPGSPP